MKRSLLFLICVFYAFTVNAQFQYQIQDFGDLTLAHSYALKINNHGTVFGTIGDEEQSFFIWNKNEEPLLFPFPDDDASIVCLNNVGQVIYKVTRGWAIFFNKRSEYYFWDPINAIHWKIEPPENWQQDFKITSLNDHGNFVITRVDDNDKAVFKKWESAYWDGKEYQQLEKDIMNVLVHINNNMQFLGYQIHNRGNGDETVLCVYNPHENKIILLEQSCNLSLASLFFNDSEIIFGEFPVFQDNKRHSFIANPRSNYWMIPIKDFSIRSMNADEVAVGQKSSEKYSSICRPAIWINGELLNLNELCIQDDDSIWKEVDIVTDINDRGQIVGQAIDEYGHSDHAILLTPVE